MTTYIIDYSDPLKTAAEGFTIQPGTFNGPGNPLPKTPLRLFGQGAPAWGEAVDENFVRMLEHFAGATPPVNPQGGQIWFKQNLYWRDTSGPFYWKWDFLTNAWVNITSSVTIVGSLPLTGTIGEHVFNTSDNKLYMFTSRYQQEQAQWHERNYSQDNLGGSPPSGIPQQEFYFYDSFNDVWQTVIPPGIDEVIIGSTPPAHSIGLFWYNTVSTPTYEQGIYVSDGSNWNRIAYLNTLNSNARIELQGNPPNLTSVLSVHHTNVTGQGDNKTHFGYTNGANIENYIRGTSTRIDTPTLTIFSNNVSFQTPGTVTFPTSSTISMSSNRIQNVAAPTTPTDAANKQYVDSTVASSIAAALPAGVILMWSGSIASIPVGWALCDGTLGTPDLRDRFIVAAGGSYVPGNMGGSSTTVAAGAHTHTTDVNFHSHGGATASHALSIAEMPPHSHNIIYGGISSSSRFIESLHLGQFFSSNTDRGGGSNNTTIQSLSIESSGSGAAHSHTITLDVHSHSLSNEPAHVHAFTPVYYALAYIMKL